MPSLNQVKNPHDRFFKANMSDLRVARSFFEAHLPVQLLKYINFDTLKLEPSSFIDKKLQELLSDLIYSVMIDDQQSYLYLIAEHQSTIPMLMPFRMLQYNCGIMEHHLKQLPIGAPQLLPLVVNLVFYHGEVTPYTASTDIFDYFVKPSLAREFMFKPFTLIDVNQIPDETLAGHEWAALFELLQKHIRERDMMAFLRKLFKRELKVKIYEDSDLLYIMIKYIAETGGVTDKEKFVELLTHALPEGDKQMPTLAEIWLEEGYQKGLHTGIEQGIEQGMEQGVKKGINQGIQKGKYIEALEIARNMLRKGLDSSLIKEVTALNDQELKELSRSIKSTH